MSVPPGEATTLEAVGEARTPKLFVSVSPHFKSTDTVSKIMWTVVATLLPPLILSVFIFGFQTLIITLVSVLSCIGTEYVSNRALGRPTDTIKDGSAAITGVLLAYVIPPGVPYWMPILGAVMAIFITKVLMGGLGFNAFNPALIGRAFLVATYPGGHDLGLALAHPGRIGLQVHGIGRGRRVCGHSALCPEALWYGGGHRKVRVVIRYL